MRLAFPGLRAALSEGVTVVTPTPTLASVAIEQFNREQIAAGLHSWERPNIYSIDAWMASCWQESRFVLSDAPSLLSPTQERELWRQIIEADRADLFDIRTMASMAQRAARTIAEYQIPIDAGAWNEHQDAKEFLRWRQTLQSQVKSRNWMTRSDLWRLLPVWINNGVLKPGPIAFVALTTTSPGLRSLSRALGDSVQNVGIAYTNQPSTAAATQFDSTALEMEYVSRSVRYLLEEHPATSIGILAADLTSHVTDLKRVLQEVLYPSSVTGDHIHIQTGTWLATPLISNALLLLELAHARIDHASAGAILRSPFIDGYTKERSLRALADQELRRSRELELSEYEIEKAAWNCPILYQVLRRIFRIKKQMLSSMPLPAWSAAFSDILETAKWPGVEHVTEAEQRAVNQWNRALSELASLGLVSPSVDFRQALSHLRAILNRPSEIGDWSSPVQVLDANSSDGIEFDHSFVVNACEDAWPPPLSLSPLIPYTLQRHHQVPASSPDAVAEERTRKTAALFTSAPRVQVTFSGKLAPLLRPHVRVATPGGWKAWSGLTAKQSYAAAVLDCQDDSQAPPLVLSAGVQGGAGIIKAQSQCPFKAFAEYRLNARGYGEASFGFDALERGECAHKALEYVWRELGSQQTLKSMPADQLRALVEKHVNQAVREDAAGGPIRALTSLTERERLVQVVTDWLKIDAERSDAFVVERLEDAREVEIAGLKLKLRMDRVDRLSNDSLVLIDYKSGIQSTKKLAGDRPTEPQLLVYAAAMNEPIEGLYFAEIRNRKPRPVGHGSAKHFPRQRSTETHANDWDEFLCNAKEAVHHLADEFKQGLAAVDPQHSACEYCDVKPICRVNTSAASEDDEE